MIRSKDFAFDYKLDFDDLNKNQHEANIWTLLSDCFPHQQTKSITTFYLALNLTQVSNIFLQQLLFSIKEEQQPSDLWGVAISVVIISAFLMRIGSSIETHVGSLLYAIILLIIKLVQYLVKYCVFVFIPIKFIIFNGQSLSILALYTFYFVERNITKKSYLRNKLVLEQTTNKDNQPNHPKSTRNLYNNRNNGVKSSDFVDLLDLNETIVRINTHHQDNVRNQHFNSYGSYSNKEFSFQNNIPSRSARAKATIKGHPQLLTIKNNANSNNQVISETSDIFLDENQDRLPLTHELFKLFLFHFLVYSNANYLQFLYFLISGVILGFISYLNCLMIFRIHKEELMRYIGW